MGGIFSGMKSYLDSEQVLGDLGDKVNDAFAESIAAARDDQWEAESHQIGPVVLSLRDGANNVIWLIELEEPVSSLGVVDMNGPSLPARPQVKLPFDDTDASAAGQR